MADHEQGAEEQQQASITGDSSENSARLFAEKSRIERLERIRQLVFGSLDGLLVPLGVVSGVAGGTGNTKAVIVAGVAEAFAGALSMGAGEFIFGRSEAQVQQTEIDKELAEMREHPEFELEEMARLLEHEGMSARDAARVAHVLAQHPEAYRRTKVEKELGLQLDVSTVKIPEGDYALDTPTAGKLRIGVLVPARSLSRPAYQ